MPSAGEQRPPGGRDASARDGAACTRQALVDVADYLGASRAVTSRVWSGVVLAWAGYLGTGCYGLDPVRDLRVMDAMVTAGAEGIDLSVLDWRP